MNDDLMTIESLLQALEAKSQEMAARLEDAAAALDSHGHPAQKDLIDELAQLRSDQMQLARMLPELPHDPLPTLSDIRGEWEKETAEPSIQLPTSAEDVSNLVASTTDDIPLQDLATIALKQAKEARTENLMTMVRETLVQNRPSVANMLSQCLAENHGQFDALQIQTWILSHSLIYYSGGIAAELRKCYDQLIDSVSDKQQHTLPSLLMTASCSLRPALIAPETGAVTLLQRVARLLPIHLSNYCRKILSLGGKRMTPSQIQTPSDSAYAKQVSALKDDIREWQNKSNSVIRYEVVEPLFLKAHWSIRAPSTMVNEAGVHQWKDWLECYKLAVSLVVPISRQDSSMTQVREALQRLTQKVGDPAVTLKSEMRSHLVELKTLAERWLILQSGQISAAEFPDEADQVFSELADQRRVHEELADLSDADRTADFQMALQCLKWSLAEIKQLATSGYDSTQEEELPDRLLHRELFFMDDVVLNSDDCPVVSPEFEDALLKYLSESQPTVQNAFERHLASGNFERAERLIATEVEESPQKERLAQQILDSREALRERLWVQFREAASILDRDSHLQSAGHVEAWKEVRQIRLALEADDPDLRGLKSRLSQLRSQLAEKPSQDNNQGWIMEF